MGSPILLTKRKYTLYKRDCFLACVNSLRLIWKALLCFWWQTAATRYVLPLITRSTIWRVKPPCCIFLHFIIILWHSRLRHLIYQNPSSQFGYRMRTDIHTNTHIGIHPKNKPLFGQSSNNDYSRYEFSLAVKKLFIDKIDEQFVGACLNYRAKIRLSRRSLHSETWLGTPTTVVASLRYYKYDSLLSSS